MAKKQPARANDPDTYLGSPWAPDPALKMPDPNIPMPELDEAGERETSVRRAHGYGYYDYV
jgi:hypothetical protein